MLPVAESLQLTQSQTVDTLESRTEAANGPIDVIDHSGLRRSCVRSIRRYDAFCDCLDGSGLIVVKVSERDRLALRRGNLKAHFVARYFAVTLLPLGGVKTPRCTSSSMFFALV